MKIAEILAAKGSATHSVGHDRDFRTAIQAMCEARIGSIIVIHSETGVLLGLISQPEILAGLTTLGASCLGHCVTGIMRRPAPSCRPEDDAGAVMRRMTNERNRHIVVTNSDAILGVISIGDLVAAQLRQTALEADVLRDMARARLLLAPS